uniref:Uncharacterized protein n=1 Tax=Chlamydomonas leiostraca TaxID=1034604 RepID=A0A7S0RSR8_9CHLO|mmetsp:Transcript_30159/g.76869  ORF Transcript_30159/g.76869 Transcript_30159/m.76869 type:complete len:106 (+) Transcript_30159:72-389(+)|eukprot:CAMPEP_0202863906 /NCGR_PEP_ID=MMETSP1391-20130828/4350_1 /ASSEMBLY_ACC=CAM_ASM_000867 /TAXON_ID=1034604 /ORGANISM="Chlamydomonas leiostraca, Strain SAG 11-49" /LENGTH=105 /DNA_ID=CAMNT_0049543589 /DNA_START=883 /DNA_END=1200 /DNA_ORIENTATION=+
MQSQTERWASLHPGTPRTGRILEVSAAYLLPRVGMVLGLAGLVWGANQKFLWVQKPASVTPEFLEEVKRIGPVAQRVNAPPVFLNPFTNRIPGSARGPEDLKKDA